MLYRPFSQYRHYYNMISSESGQVHFLYLPLRRNSFQYDVDMIKE
jgi:hypothetical protein